MQHFEISDTLWPLLSDFFPKYGLAIRGGRPRLNVKRIFEGILFIKGHNLPWRAMPKLYGSKTAINDYYREWSKMGVFHNIKASGLLDHP